MDELLSYKDVLNLPSIEFCDYLERYRTMFLDIVESDADAHLAGLKLQRVAANYTIITALMSYARALKRDYKGKGMTDDYNDMVDKEKILSNTLSAIDIQYKAINRILVLHSETQRELGMSSAFT